MPSSTNSGGYACSSSAFRQFPLKNVCKRGAVCMSMSHGACSPTARTKRDLLGYYWSVPSGLSVVVPPVGARASRRCHGRSESPPAAQSALGSAARSLPQDDSNMSQDTSLSIGTLLYPARCHVGTRTTIPTQSPCFRVRTCLPSLDAPAFAGTIEAGPSSPITGTSLPRFRCRMPARWPVAQGSSRGV